MTTDKKLQLPLDVAGQGVWACVSKEHNLLAKFSLAESEKESISLFMEGATATWEYYQRTHGWCCVPITIQIPTP
jgi:hypothetical protein